MDVRNRVIDGITFGRGGRWLGWRQTLMAVAAVGAMALAGIAYRQVIPDNVPLSVEPAPVISASTISGAQPANVDAPITPEVDAVAQLQQVRLTVRRPDFRPLWPGYLPKGARLDDVNLAPDRPGGPIARLEVAFVARGNQLRLHQEREAMRQQMPWGTPAVPPQRVVAGGREWLYIARGLDADGQQSGILIGSRDGVVIWLESSLPVDELAKIAASLEE